MLRIHVGFEGNFGTHSVTPRSLSSHFVSKLVSVQGVVTRCSLVRPKVVRSVHYCPATSNLSHREYRDATDISDIPTGTVYPSVDDKGNRLETEFGLSTYKDSQTFTIQEMPESAPLGQMPRSVEVIVEGDLVDFMKPGDRVDVTGIYRALTGSTAGTMSSGMFRTVLLAGSIRKLGKDASNIHLTAQDIHNCIEFSKRENAFDLIARSLAPSIYGHQYVKQALALLLLGGREHNLPNGTHLRGDINILMVGDPSTAKSQLLRFVLNLAPVAVNTTGRGSSGVGLTAAVTTDPETGERKLEAGAMVLADRGVVCIDEFDKMNSADVVAIHEVMEQQTVTIAKAGIQASLNARCSVVAAANPVYGRFSLDDSLAKNLSMPDSLLSRFDLIFIILDKKAPHLDLRLARHVTRIHQYVIPGMEGIPIPLDARVRGSDTDNNRDGDGTTPVFQQYNPILHGGAVSDSHGGSTDILTIEFLRKYFFYAKSLPPPVLTNQARDEIVTAYNILRQNLEGRLAPVTARSLETIIRMSTAHAKARLSRKVFRQDVIAAMEILKYALYGSHLRTLKVPEETEADAAPAGGSSMGDRNADVHAAATPSRSRKRTLRAAAEAILATTEMEALEDHDPSSTTPSRSARRLRRVEGGSAEEQGEDKVTKGDEFDEDEEEEVELLDVDSDDYQSGLQAFSTYRETYGDEVKTTTLSRILEWIPGHLPDELRERLFTTSPDSGRKWVKQLLATMAADNLIMDADGVYYFV